MFASASGALADKDTTLLMKIKQLNLLRCSAIARHCVPFPHKLLFQQLMAEVQPAVRNMNSMFSITIVLSTLPSTKAIVSILVYY